MYNSKPLNTDLPSSRQLLRSTIIAFIVAVLLLVTVVLPSEYAIDPTGIGRMLGLTEMGEIKGQLAEEATADAARDAAAVAAAARAPVSSAASSASPAAPATPAVDTTQWRDEMQVELAPGQGAEVKLAMTAGQKANFAWTAQGGVVNFDTHGDGGTGGESTSYEKGRGVAADEGVLEAAFNGNHGWFWRNRSEAEVTITLRTAGDYAQIKRVM
ncbi:transmembrane anchor protein [Pseudoxanthomonas sp.]|uniref:transmembrane anchor protein n=1 Tax=Pseudoxanthomonas sp. TaxID=1871049 RepID=UPI0025FD06CA|nr:transmembrane anchor protein [Pseudoxanthomonas sp.]